MKIKNSLEIILITYQRHSYLQNVLRDFFSPQSPPRDLDFTILDNASTDGTSELCKEYAAKFPNINYIRHNKNIGGNANIARAFELAKKEYVWIICDDDKYDFAGWQEIEDAVLSKKYDIILTSQKHIAKNASNLAQIFKELTFLPSGIYKTANITGTVLQNAYNNIPNLFPHLAVVCEVINKKGSFFIPSKNFIPERDLDSLPWKTMASRGMRGSYVSPIVRNMFWAAGYINSLEMIQNAKIKTEILNKSGRAGFFLFIFSRFRRNKKDINNNSRNIYNAWVCFNFWQKIQFALALILLDVLYLFNFKR
jgi:glycosyltransferase involved in cell wall biosynthesis